MRSISRRQGRCETKSSSAASISALASTPTRCRNSATQATPTKPPKSERGGRTSQAFGGGAIIAAPRRDRVGVIEDDGEASLSRCQSRRRDGFGATRELVDDREGGALERGRFVDPRERLPDHDVAHEVRISIRLPTRLGLHYKKRTARLTARCRGQRL